VTSCLVLVSPTGVAHAQVEAAAAEQFRAAAEAYARGEFRTAARAFEQAHRLAPRGPTILNAARAWEAAKVPAAAADAYEAALEIGGLTEAEATLAREHLTALEPGLAVLSVDGPSRCVVSVAHRERSALPTRIHLAPGAHSLTADFANGRSEVRRLELSKGETKSLVLQAPARTWQPRSPKAEPRSSRASASSGQSTLGWVLMGVGVAASGAAIYFGVTALDARDSYANSGRRDEDAYDRAKRFRLLTNLAWASAAAAGGTGLFLVLTAPADGASEPRAIVGYAADL
jgi:tetratricopeptide (TPR) repeat protein